ncbi:MAG: leucine-rich repeat domain-containing protein [Prevotellaceae bacterium]|nr:leucine-rich repeat domain-containing protein [Prevotellaceae bacterium]
MESNAFGYCTGLTSITIPNSVTSIGDDAFYYCNSLTSITIPSSVTSIGISAFMDCTSLTEITIPNSVTSIGFQAFCDCTSLTSITIPSSVTSIGGGAFGGCSSLTDVTIPNSVTSIGDNAFAVCNFTSVTIPNSVTSIGDFVFSGCSSLVSIEVASDNAYYCSVDDVLYTKDMTELIAFPAGEGVTSYEIPNSVTSIRGGAFCGCSSLTSVTIGSSVTSIGGAAFDDCSSLTKITSVNPEPPTCYSQDVFYNVDRSTCTLTVPKGSKAAYAAANAWREFNNIVEDPLLGVKTTAISGEGQEASRFTLDGKQITAPQRGVNIIRLSDGMVRKVLVK